MAATPETDLRKVEKVSSFSRILSPARSPFRAKSSKGSSPSSSSSNNIFKKLARKFSSTKKRSSKSPDESSSSDSESERGTKDDIKIEATATTKENIKEVMTAAEKLKEPSTEIIEKTGDLASKIEAVVDPKTLKEEFKESKSNMVEAIEHKVEKIVGSISSIVHIDNKSTDDHKQPDKGTDSHSHGSSSDDHRGAGDKKLDVDGGAHKVLPISTIDQPSDHNEEDKKEEEKVDRSKENEENTCCISSLAQGLQAMCAPK